MRLRAVEMVITLAVLAAGCVGPPPPNPGPPAPLTPAPVMVEQWEDAGTLEGTGDRFVKEFYVGAGHGERALALEVEVWAGPTRVVVDVIDPWGQHRELEMFAIIGLPGQSMALFDKAAAPAGHHRVEVSLEPGLKATFAVSWCTDGAGERIVSACQALEA